MMTPDQRAQENAVFLTEAAKVIAEEAGFAVLVIAINPGNGEPMMVSHPSLHIAGNPDEKQVLQKMLEVVKKHAPVKKRIKDTGA